MILLTPNNGVNVYVLDIGVNVYVLDNKKMKMELPKKSRNMNDDVMNYIFKFGPV